MAVQGLQCLLRRLVVVIIHKSVPQTLASMLIADHLPTGKRGDGGKGLHKKAIVHDQRKVADVTGGEEISGQNDPNLKKEMKREGGGQGKKKEGKESNKQALPLRFVFRIDIGVRSVHIIRVIRISSSVSLHISISAVTLRERTAGGRGRRSGQKRNGKVRNRKSGCGGKGTEVERERPNTSLKKEIYRLKNSNK